MPALRSSELPEVMRTRHHPIVIARPPHRNVLIALAVTLVLALIWPWPWTLILLLAIASGIAMRARTWNAELIILTQHRIVRSQGVPETTTSEAFLRVDRVAGARLVQTVPGKLLHYGTIELEAPGNHPDVRRLKRILEAPVFYDRLCTLMLAKPAGGGGGPGRADGPGTDPDEPDGLAPASEHITAPLPRIPFQPPTQPRA